MIFVSVIKFDAKAMVEREYTLQEVLDACLYIVFGTVESVNDRRMNTIIAVKENLKRKGPFKTLKMNVAVGQHRGRLSSPKLMMQKLKVGAPVIFFYRRSEVRPSFYKGLGHVSGTWFQMETTDSSGKGRTWWNFTHIEAYMHRTFKGSTEEFQRVVRGALAGKDWPTARRNDLKVLVLNGNKSKLVLGEIDPESSDVSRLSGTPVFLALKRIRKVNQYRLAYQSTKDKQLPQLQDADILWVGRREFAANKYFLTPETENRIKEFVRKGGVVVVNSQDTDKKRVHPTGWLPEPLLGMELPKVRDLRPTANAGNLFRMPNKVSVDQLTLSDTWTNWSDSYAILATTAKGKGIAVATLRYGKGLYVITNLENRTEEDVSSNRKLIENLMFYAVQWYKNR